MLDGDRRQMRVRNQIGTQRLPQEDPVQNRTMSLRGLGNPDRRAVQPFLDLPPGRGDRFRLGEYPGIRDQPDESQKAWPWKPDSPAAVQLIIKPSESRRVLIHGIDVGVDEEIGVHEDHLSFSPSAIVSVPATSSKLPIRQRPRETVLVRKRLRGRRGLAIWSNPWRRVSLTTCLNETSRSLLSRSN